MQSEAISGMITLPPGSENRREEVTQGVHDAQTIVKAFAAAYDWSPFVKEPFFSRVEIHSDQEALWRRMLEVNGVSDIPMPTDTLTAALEKGSLMAVFFEDAQRARPEYFQTRLDWVQALAHEMIHQLHVRILNGDENAMGPQWFYEGFAVVGSGQLLGRALIVQNVEQALELTVATGRGCYACYATALRFLMERISLQRLVDYAASPDFETLLRTEA